MPEQPPTFGPRCGSAALGHDEDRAYAFALAVDDAASPFALSIEKSSASGPRLGTGTRPEVAERAFREMVAPPQLGCTLRAPDG